MCIVKLVAEDKNSFNQFGKVQETFSQKCTTLHGIGSLRYSRWKVAKLQTFKKVSPTFREIKHES